jgi:tetratricopeptide (TPR) repeat protein
MDAKPPLRKALALELVEVSTPAGDGSSPDAKGQRDLRMTTLDEFLAQAAREYEAGNIDQALWHRAADQCGDDASLAVAAYLRTRATALQLKHKQGERSETQARGATSTQGASDGKAQSEPHAEIVSTKFTGVRPRDPKSKLIYLAAAAAAVAAVVAVVYLLVSPRGRESVQQPIVSAAAASPSQSAPPTPLKNEQPVVKTTSGGTNQDDPGAKLEATVQQLKSVGKWNVLVLYAAEWTRQDPNNATAWNELSVGYAKLQQFNDALDAATKAVQLSPGDPLLWRNLGQINLAVDRLPEAGIAFDKALALSPDDTDARCGAVLVAERQARPKDRVATVRRVKPVDGSCPDVTYGENATVAARSAATR